MTRRILNFDVGPSYMGMEVPDHTAETLENYLLRGWSPGGFVEAMLAHDYDRAFASADTGNRQMIWAIWKWIIDEAPPLSHGSYKATEMWRGDVDGRRTAFADPILKSAVWKKLSTV